MKKNRLVLLLVPMAFSSLTGCATNKVSLTFGTYVKQSVNTLEEIDNFHLANMIEAKEVFLLAVYQGSYSEDCTCWSTFKNIIASYMNKYSERVYVYDAHGKVGNNFRSIIETNMDSSPTLYILKGQTTLAKFYEKNSKDQSIFTDTSCTSMYQRVHKYVDKPKAYYVDDDYLKENLSSASKTVVAFIRNGCSDCNYVVPKIIIPYINNHKFSNNLWVFDMQNTYETSKSETATEEEKGQYQALKDRYGLSAASNASFGYQQGVVPTTQYYENGILKDASVFFNDVVGQKEDGSFYISDSYYSPERLFVSPFIQQISFDSIHHTVEFLKDMSIASEDAMQNQSGGYYWAQEAAAKYHTPLLERFLDYYLS